MKRPDKRLVVGWIAVCISTVLSTVWACWGIIENFHEGWYFESLPANLGLMLAQYLSPMLLFTGIALVSIFWPRIGAGLHLALAFVAIGFFQAFSNAATFLIILPLVGTGLLYWFGRVEPRKAALAAVVGFPVLALAAAGIGPAWRVSQRVDDGNLQARMVRGNGVALTWAPDGPGWPREGVNWREAKRRCEYLGEDGLTIHPTPQHIWRLPTVDEAVRSMSRRGKNSGGMWQAADRVATYVTAPDKESPLWNVHSQVIYWWTATQVDQTRALIIVYDGQVWPRDQQLRLAYLGFRCVKDPAPEIQ